eukprot:TRINITY_DN5919_c0_g1_i1.p1 TRINITY_DN5919_c0_g1~~TRINITY_DN5919_c0_g1_i1.p1  ORF type:complete len:448 (+),score=97.26 TRINITY_DN5919_c0_g1_i1:109-1452(+)
MTARCIWFAAVLALRCTRAEGARAAGLGDVAAWVKGKGGRVHPAVAMAQDAHGGRGLVVAENASVAMGDELAFIPAAAGIEASEGSVVGAEGTPGAAELQLAARFLRVWKAEAAAPGSTGYGPYLATLPEGYATGTALSDDEAGCLSASAQAIKSEYDAMRAAHVSALLDFAQLDAGLRGIDVTRSDALYAFHTVLTRAVRASDERAPALYPVFDILNHDQSAPNVVVEATEGGIRLVAAARVAAGTPLTLNYGRHLSPNKILVFHGFADKTHGDVQGYLSFPADNADLAELGCRDAEAVVVHRGGTVSQKLIECVVFSILPAEGRAAYMALDAEARAEVVAERRLDAAEVYTGHLTQVLALYPSPHTAPCDAKHLTSPLGRAVLATNELLRAAYLRAHDALKDEVRASGRRRRVEVAGASKPKPIKRRREPDPEMELGEDEDDWDM